MTSQAPTAERLARDSKASGPTKYRAVGRRPPAPVFSVAASTAANIAVETLAPWDGHNYPGRLKIAWATFHGRAADGTIRDWRRGRRKPPQWALDLLDAALAERQAAIEHARALLAKEKGRL